jgi:hypothetical protein
VPFVPQAARPYLSTAQVADPLSPNDTLAPLRREALDVLGRAYASRTRLGAGALAWFLGLGAALLGAAAVDRWPATDGGAEWLAGGAALLGVCAAALGVTVVRAGSVLSRAVAAWLATPTRGARTRDAARPHRAIAMRTVLGTAATLVLVGVLGLLLTAGPAVTTDLRHLLGLGAAALVNATAAVSLLSGVNRIHAAAWRPAPVPPRPPDFGDGSAETRHTGVMLLVPVPARNFLDPADYRRDWTTYGSMMIRRQVAMRTLLPAYADLGRLGAGVLAWLAGHVGATVLRAGVGDETALGLTGTAAAVVGGVLLVLGVGAGVVVVVAGSKLSRGLALWALLPLLVRADGARRAPGSARTAPPSRGPGDPTVSLASRLVAAAVVAGVAVAWTVDVVRDGIVVLAPYSTTSDLGVLLASVLGAGVSWTAAATSWRGCRRVRSALDGRVGPSQEAAALRELHGGHGTGRAPSVPAAGAVAPFAPGAAGPAAAGATHVEGQQPARGGAPRPDPSGDAGPAAPEPAAEEVPVRPVAPVPARPHRSEVAQVRVDGRLLEPGTTLVGRAPAARAGERIDHTLAVEDPTMSKTHLAVRVTPAGVWVTDRASTNGTTVVAGRDERRLDAWQETKVPSGARVRAGATVLAVADDETDHEVERTVLRGTP